MNHIQEHINTSTRKHPHVEHMEININEIYKNIERERERENGESRTSAASMGEFIMMK